MSIEGSAPRALLVALAGYAVMYLPVYWWAAGSIWQSDDHAHGAIVLAVVVWLFWTMRGAIAEAPTKPSLLLGTPIFAFGLLMYLVGRVFSISIFELGSQIFMITGALMLLKGF